MKKNRSETIFVSIPKTAHSAINQCLSEDIKVNVGYAPIGGIDHPLPWLETGRGQFMVTQIGEEKWNDCIVFTAVRNPFDRAVSSWLEINGLTRGVFRSFKIFLLKLKHEGFHNDVLNWHAMEQYKNIVDAKGNLLVDFIIRFEDLQKDYDTLRNMLGLQPQTLKVVNKKQSAHYSSHYDGFCISLVEEIYAKDIEMFDYRFEDVGPGSPRGRW